MPLYSAQVIVLKRREFEETGKLLTLFSRELGKLSAIAKGSRRPLSRLVGSTEPLVFAKMQLATGRNLDIISESTLKHPFAKLRQTPELVQASLYLAELTDALVDERQPSPDLFDLLLSSLYQLESQTSPDLVIRRFEMQALDIAGYGLETQRCLRCRAGRPEGRSATVSAELGGILCTRCRKPEQSVVLVKGDALDAMHALRTMPAHRLSQYALSDAANESIANVIFEHMRSHLDHDLKTGRVSMRDLR